MGDSDEFRRGLRLCRGLFYATHRDLSERQPLQSRLAYGSEWPCVLQSFVRAPELGFAARSHPLLEVTMWRCIWRVPIDGAGWPNDCFAQAVDGVA